MLVVLALVLLGAIVAGAVRWADDGISGPHGRFPEALAASPPEKTARLVGTGSFPIACNACSFGVNVLVYGGLAVGNGPTGPADGLYATGIASGKVFWHYDRPADLLAVDRAGQVIASVGDHHHDLVAINSRSAQVRWTLSPDIGRIVRVVALPNGNLVAYGSKTIVGIDPATGHTRWKQPWECWQEKPVVSGGTVAVRCGERKIEGIDATTGRIWSVQAEQILPGAKIAIGAGPQERLAAVVDNGRRRLLVLLDPATGQVRTRHDTTERATYGDHLKMVFAGGVQVGLCPAKGSTQDVCGTDPDTGHLLWRSPAPDGYSIPPAWVHKMRIAVAATRVYVTLKGRDGSSRMAALDVRTGAPLGQWSLPSKENSVEMSSFDTPVTDGVILLKYQHLGGSAPSHEYFYLYADSPVPANPRNLFTG